MTMEQAAMISTLAQIKDLITDGPVAVRYSRDHNQDIKRGYSIDHAAGQREAGLSCMVITSDDAREGDGWLARLIADYSYMIPQGGGGYGWLARGKIAGRDSDGARCIRDVVYLDRLSDDFVRRCTKFSLAYHERRRDDRREPPWPQPADYGI